MSAVSLNAMADIPRFTRPEEEIRFLRERLTTVTEESRQLSTRYVELEQQNSDLIKLYVAHARLQGATSRQEAMAALHEIVLTLIGSERFAVLEPVAGQLRVTSSFGITALTPEQLPGAVARVRDAARTGALFVAPRDSADNECQLTACVPLWSPAGVKGVIAIYELLPHKVWLDQLDFALLDLLTSLGGRALYCADVLDLLRGAVPE